jgi:hypothetical protein
VSLGGLSSLRLQSFFAPLRETTTSRMNFTQRRKEKPKGAKKTGK